MESLAVVNDFGHPGCGTRGRYFSRSRHVDTDVIIEPEVNAVRLRRKFLCQKSGTFIYSGKQNTHTIIDLGVPALELGRGDTQD